MTDSDKALHKGLMKILNEATFSLKAREVVAFSTVYNWANLLPDKFESIKEPVKKKTKAKKVIKP